MMIVMIEMIIMMMIDVWIDDVTLQAPLCERTVVPALSSLTHPREHIRCTDHSIAVSMIVMMIT